MCTCDGTAGRSLPALTGVVGGAVGAAPSSSASWPQPASHRAPPWHGASSAPIVLSPEDGEARIATLLVELKLDPLIKDASSKRD